MALIMGVVAFSIGKIPTFLTLQDCVTGIQQVFDEASTQSIVQGQLVTIDYSAEGKSFNISGGAAPSPDAGSTSGEAPPERPKDFTGSNHLSYALPESAKIEFPSDLQGITQDKKFYFYADGTGSGSDIILTLKGHKVMLRLSKLTGALTKIEVPDDDK